MITELVNDRPDIELKEEVYTEKTGILASLITNIRHKGLHYYPIDILLGQGSLQIIRHELDELNAVKKGLLEGQYEFMGVNFVIHHMPSFDSMTIEPRRHRYLPLTSYEAVAMLGSIPVLKYKLKYDV